MTEVWARAVSSSRRPEPRIKLAHWPGKTVWRWVDAYDRTKGQKVGHVTAVYCGLSDYGNGPVFYPELYNVDFGDGREDCGYFDYGLDSRKSAWTVKERRND